MAEKTDTRKENPPERRRFLRESLTGSVPLLLGWATSRVSSLARLIQEPTAPRKTSPPPAATDSAPAPVKDELDQHYQEFARDNPDTPDPSSQ
ncbi:MAG: hypothetical protein ACE5IP_11550 [Terriglobia bacterium]